MQPTTKRKAKANGSGKPREPNAYVRAFASGNVAPADGARVNLLDGTAIRRLGPQQAGLNTGMPKLWGKVSRTPNKVVEILCGNNLGIELFARFVCLHVGLSRSVARIVLRVRKLRADLRPFITCHAQHPQTRCYRPSHNPRMRCQLPPLCSLTKALQMPCGSPDGRTIPKGQPSRYVPPLPPHPMCCFKRYVGFSAFGNYLDKPCRYSRALNHACMDRFLLTTVREGKPVCFSRLSTRHRLSKSTRSSESDPRTLSQSRTSEMDAWCSTTSARRGILTCSYPRSSHRRCSRYVAYPSEQLVGRACACAVQCDEKQLKTGRYLTNTLRLSASLNVNVYLQ
jgi:hypothetical protein